jgi:hypothetical protein
MMSNPDVADLALPDFLAKKVPLVELGEWQDRKRFEPRYDHPAFQSAFNELTGLLADAYDGHPQVEYVDTAMYGFWGEGHTWPLERNPFPDYATAEATWVRMFEQQLKHWKKTPLATNTQPDFSKVGNFELLERTVRSHNWLRTDTISSRTSRSRRSATGPHGPASRWRYPMPTGRPRACISIRA